MRAVSWPKIIAYILRFCQYELPLLVCSSIAIELFRASPMAIPLKTIALRGWKEQGWSSHWKMPYDEGHWISWLHFLKPPSLKLTLASSSIVNVKGWHNCGCGPCKNPCFSNRTLVRGTLAHKLWGSVMPLISLVFWGPKMCRSRLTSPITDSTMYFCRPREASTLILRANLEL